MKKETCKTCRHHTAEIIEWRNEETEDGGTEEVPVFRHYCNGKPMPEATLEFRCGLYKERTI